MSFIELEQYGQELDQLKEKIEELRVSLDIEGRKGNLSN